MAGFGKRKDGQAYPKNRTSKQRKSGSIVATGIKIKKQKGFKAKSNLLKKVFHRIM